MKGKELRIKELKDNQLVFLEFNFNNVTQCSCELDREFEAKLNSLRKTYKDGLYKVNLKDQTFISVVDASITLKLNYKVIENIYEWTDKCFCQILDEDKKERSIIIEGDIETSLRMEKYNNVYSIVGSDYNSVGKIIKYCPFCGRKLGDD